MSSILNADPARAEPDASHSVPPKGAEATSPFDRRGWLAAHYRCPRCRSELAEDGTALRCSDPGCPGSGGFPVAGEKPVLIDFENSVMDESRFRGGSGRSPTRRRQTRWWDRFTRTHNRVAEANGPRFAELMRRRSRHPVLLIVGGGDRGAGTQCLYSDPDLRVVSFDIYNSAEIDFIADGHSIPLASASVDGVWVQAVLEHVLIPEKVVAEIHRVLKPDGLVYAETPFIQQVHEAAYDFTRFTESGHRWLFRRFELIDSGACVGPAEGLAWSLRYFLRGLLRHNKLATALLMPLFWVRSLDRFIPARYAIDGASGVFFMGRRSDTELTPKDIVRHYKGAGQ